MDLNFEQQVLQELARIAANQECIAENCTSYREKVDHLEIKVAGLASSDKSAHHRINEIKQAKAALKEELTKAIKEQTDGVYRTAAFVGGVTSFVIGLFMWMFK